MNSKGVFVYILRLIVKFDCVQYWDAVHFRLLDDYGIILALENHLPIH